MPERRRLTRSTNRLIAGVCAGLADYLDLDATLVRIGFIVLALFSLGFGAIVAYVVSCSTWGDLSATFFGLRHKMGSMCVPVLPSPSKNS